MSYSDYSECPYLSTGGFFGLTYRCAQNNDAEISKHHYEDYCRENSRYKTEDCEYYSNNGSVCFLTMSCIKKKLSNHCLELENLRSFRDSYMYATAEGRLMVETYYEVSPQIVKAINRDNARNMIWGEIYNYIVECNKFINRDQPKAMEMFKTMMYKLCTRYKIPITV